MVVGLARPARAHRREYLGGARVARDDRGCAYGSRVAFVRNVASDIDVQCQPLESAAPPNALIVGGVYEDGPGYLEEKNGEWLDLHSALAGQSKRVRS